jgi:hypothetical protein
MDARIVVEPALMRLAPVEIKGVVTTTRIDDLVCGLKSLFDPATILAPLLAMGNSVTAVAPDFTLRGGKSALAHA